MGRWCIRGNRFSQAWPKFPRSTRKNSSARRWLDAERLNLLATATHTAAHGWAEHCLWLSATLFRPLQIRGAYADSLIIHGAALDAARRGDDVAGQIRVLNDLASAHLSGGRLRQAVVCLQQSLALSGRLGDEAGRGPGPDPAGGCA